MSSVIAPLHERPVRVSSRLPGSQLPNPGRLAKALIEEATTVAPASSGSDRVIIYHCLGSSHWSHRHRKTAASRPKRLICFMDAALWTTRATQVQFGRVGVESVRMGKTPMREDGPVAKLRELTVDEDSTREHFL